MRYILKQNNCSSRVFLLPSSSSKFPLNLIKYAPTRSVLMQDNNGFITILIHGSSTMHVLKESWPTHYHNSNEMGGGVDEAVVFCYGYSIFCGDWRYGSSGGVAHEHVGWRPLCTFAAPNNWCILTTFHEWRLSSRCLERTT